VIGLEGIEQFSAAGSVSISRKPAEQIDEFGDQPVQVATGLPMRRGAHSDRHAVDQQGLIAQHRVQGQPIESWRKRISG
jgi:hypothetical protein